MEVVNAAFIKSFYEKMGAYYDEVELQKLLNLVEDLDSKPEITFGEALDTVSSMKLCDRHTAIALAIIYQKPMAYMVLQNVTDMLIPNEVDKLRNSIINKTEDEFFKGYSKYDFYCLERCIVDDEEDELDNPVWNIEKEILCNYVEYKEGKRAKVLAK